MPGRVVLRLADGQSLEIPAKSITFLGYSRDAVPDTGMIGLPTLAGPVPIFYMGWVRKAGLHYIAIDHARADGTSARILLQADKKNYGSILGALSGATGLPVSLTSQDRKHLGKTVATTTLDQPLRRLPGVPAWPVDSLAGHRKEVRAVAFSADGSAFASVEGDGTVLVWNLAERRVTSRLLTRQPDTTGIALAPYGKSVAVWSMWKGGVSIWDAATQQSLGQIAGSPGRRVHTVAFSPQAQTLAVLDAPAVSSSGNDAVRLWRLPSLQEAGQLPAGVMGRGSDIQHRRNDVDVLELDGPGVRMDGREQYTCEDFSDTAGRQPRIRLVRAAGPWTGGQAAQPLGRPAGCVERCSAWGSLRQRQGR
ncbi:MAG: hypothetical protein ABIS06_12690 [Vicinamibacterales bacterium]